MKRLMAVFVCVTLTGSAYGTDPNELAQQLEELIALQEQLTERITSLEAQLAVMKTKQSTIEETQTEMQGQVGSTPEKLVWLEKIKLNGDFRYRYEHIDMEHKRSRRRHRIRARLGINYELSDTLDFAFWIASGNLNDPVSTNQTLGNAFSTKNVWIDQAYLDWHPDQVAGSHLTLGKFKNPFYVPAKTELVWDGDLRPEGIAATYEREWDNGLALYAVAGAFWADERKADSDPVFLAAQAALTYNFADDRAHVTGALGGFWFDRVEHKGLLFTPGDAFGNSVVYSNPLDLSSTKLYAEDFDEIELSGEVGFHIYDVPVVLFGDYVVNTAADDDDTGYLYGFKAGKCKAKGSWEFAYNYRKVEKDAVLGVWTDSDFIGGGTDGKGHELQLGYQVSKRAKLKASYFNNEKWLDDPHDFERFMLDLSVKF